jgi:hypothetical protein
MRITRLSSVFTFLLTAALATVSAVAQENYGAILGTVLDQSGAGVPGAKLSASSPTLPRPIEVESDDSGRYTMPRVPVGVYVITVTKSGFATVKQNNVDVKLGSQITLNPSMKVSSIAETIEVSDSAVSIDPTSSRTQVNITNQVFDNLPRSRSFESILTMAPGVRLEPKASSSTGMGNDSRTTGIQVDGASGSENSFVIDGVDVSDVRRGTLRSNSAIPFEFISDVQVKSAGMEADAGGATGGVVNIATRSGSNDFHGQLLYQFTSELLNPRPRGFWKLSPFNANVADFFAPKEDEYATQYPGFMLGGPIIKNRLFFNAGYMPVFSHRFRAVDYTTAAGLPNGSRQFRQDTRQHFSLMRVDYNPLSKLQINTSWIWSPAKVIGQLAGQDGRNAAPPANDLSIQGGFQPAQQYSASATYTFNSRFLVSARYGYRYQNDKLFNYGLSALPFITYVTASPTDVPLPGGVNYSNVSSTLAIVKDQTTRHNVYLDGSYLTGRHSFKFGFALNRLANEVSTDYTNGRFQIYWNEAFSRGSFNNVRGALGYYLWQDGVRQNNGANSRNQGFYVNDNWRVNNRLTLNLGVRFESEFLPPFTQSVNGRAVGNPISFDWGSKIAPRLGAAWDVLGDGKWKLSGSFGLYYDVMKYELARGSFGGDYWFTYAYRLDNPNVLSLSKANPGALGSAITNYNNRSLPINPTTGAWDGVDPDMKPYSQREFTVRLDHALSNRLTGTIRYSRKRLLRVIEDIGVLDSEGSEQYVIGNPGFGLTRNDPQHVYDGKAPSGEFLVPKAKRDYDGLEFRVQGQITRNTYALASYTYSRLYGNYSGQANSDENGRSDPGVSRAFDLPYYYFNSKGQNAEGRLATDRPHAITFFGSHDIKWLGGATNIGISQAAFSGTPLSTQLGYISAPTFPNGRGDLGRTPFFTQTDLTIKHTFKISERWSIAPEAYAQNLFNQAAVLNTQQTIQRTGNLTTAQLPLSKFFSGYNVNDYVNPSNPTPGIFYSPIYRLPISYQNPREIRLGLRIMF